MQREREWASSLMRRRAVSQKPGRNIQAERSVSVLNEMSSKEVTEITHIEQPFWVFVSYDQLFWFFFHTWLALGPSPRCVCNFLQRGIPLKRPVGTYPHLLGGGAPLSDPRSFLAHVQTGKSSMTSGRDERLSLYFSRCQLSPLALSLECLGENKT